MFLILAAIAFGPATVLVNNPESPSPLTATVVVAVILTTALALRWALIQWGASAIGTTYGVAVFVLAFMNTGPLVGSFPAGRWGLLALATLAGVVAYGLRNLRLNEILITWGAFALVIAPLLTWLGNWSLSSDDFLQIDEPIEISAFVSTPDIVLIVADGYASNQVLSEFYGYDNSQFSNELAAIGATVNHEMTSNYARTKLSIPSLLQLGYLKEGTLIVPALEANLLKVLGGENRIADAVRANGYRTVYVESGWLGTKCSASIDVCVSGPWPDETLYDVAFRSLMRDVPGFETGRSFARGTLHTLSWLDRELAEYLDDDQPDFIYVHLLAPHPPMFLDESCESQASVDVSGFALGMPWSTASELEVRREAYVQQVECVNRHLVKAAAAITEAGAVGLFLSDHGPDQGAQLFFNGDDWTEDQRKERFGVLFAAIHPECDYQTVSSLVNAGRRLLTCLSGTELPDLPDRYFDLRKSSDESRVMELDAPGVGQ